MKVITAIKDFVLSGYEEPGWERVGPAFSHSFSQPQYVKINEPPRLNPMFSDFEESEFSEMPVPNIVEDAEDEHLAVEPEIVIEEEVAAEPQLNQEMVEAIKAESLAIGREQGMIEGKAKAEEEYNKKFAELKEDFIRFSTDVRRGQGDFNQKLEKEALKLATQISKRILMITVEARPEYIVEVIQRAFQESGVNKPLRIRLSPKDYEFVRNMEMPEELATLSSQVEYLPDANIKAGCTVETETGNFDFRVDNTWYEVAAQLGELYK